MNRSSVSTDGTTAVSHLDYQPGTRHASAPGRRAMRGFSLVELIVVLSLMGILSVAAYSRLSAPDAFAPSMVAHRLATELRLAQQLALQRADVVLTTEVQQVGESWRFLTLADGVTELRNSTVAVDGTNIVVTVGGAATALSDVAGLTLSFDPGGELTAATVGGAALVVDGGLDLTVAGGSSRSLCVYPSGYASKQVCS